MTAPRKVPVRRSAGLVAACGALLITGLSAPPDARAAEIDPRWSTEIDVDTWNYTDGPGECAIAGATPDNDGSLEPGTPTVSSVSGSYTVTNSDDAADTASFEAEGTARWVHRQGGGGFSGFDMTAQASVSGEHALGEETACRVDLEVNTHADGQDTVPSDGFLEATLSTDDEMRAEFFLGQDGGNTLFLATGTGGFMKRSVESTARLFVEEGPIYYLAYAGLDVRTPDYDDDILLPVRRRAAEPLATGSSTASITFVPAGSTMGKANGSGKKYVKLGTRSCASGKVTTTMKAKAKKAAKMTYYVDGSKAKTVNNPKKGKKVKLAVAAASDAEVEVVVKPKKGKKVSVTRGYVACTG